MKSTKSNKEVDVKSKFDGPDLDGKYSDVQMMELKEAY